MHIKINEDYNVVVNTALWAMSVKQTLDPCRSKG